MAQVKESFVVDAKGKKISVILPIKEYKQLLENLQELEDIKAYDKAMSQKLEFIPLEQALKQITTSR